MRNASYFAVLRYTGRVSVSCGVVYGILWPLVNTTHSTGIPHTFWPFLYGGRPDYRPSSDTPRRRRRRQPAPSQRRRTSPAGSANAFGTGKFTKLGGVAGDRRGRSDAPVECREACHRGAPLQEALFQILDQNTGRDFSKLKYYNLAENHPKSQSFPLSLIPSTFA